MTWLHHMVGKPCPECDEVPPPAGPVGDTASYPGDQPTAGERLSDRLHDELERPMQNDCDHYWASHVRGGEPVAVRICMLCQAIDWDDLRAEIRRVIEHPERLAP